MAKWLDQHMPEGMRILSSPALRCESTAAALGRKYKLCPELKPDSNVESLLDIAGWPDAKTPALIIGHQPTLGQVVTHALHVPTANFSVRKGSVWWLRNRWRMHEQSAIVHCVQTPDLLW
jgi:phosphohistidine phosphatase